MMSAKGTICTLKKLAPLKPDGANLIFGFQIL